MKWNLSDINKLAARGMTVYVSPVPKNRLTIPRQDSPQVIWLHWNLLIYCGENDLTLEKEFRFSNKRFWRFDFAIPEIKTAIEYNGLISEKSRHTTIGGYSADMEKLNAAQGLGWKVLQYTALNYRNVLQDLKNLQ